MLKSIFYKQLNVFYSTNLRIIVLKGFQKLTDKFDGNMKRNKIPFILKKMFNLFTLLPIICRKPVQVRRTLQKFNRILDKKYNKVYEM